MIALVLLLAVTPPQLRLARDSSVASVEVFVLSGKTRAGAALSCAELPRDWLTSRADVIVRFRQTSAVAPLTLEKIPELKAAVLVVDGYAQADALGPRTAYGCRDNVSFSAGKTLTLDLALQSAF